MLRLATFNLKDFFLGRKDSEHAIVEAKLANVAENLRRAHADVVALQEVGSGALLDRLIALLPELAYGAPVVGEPDHRGIRNAILSRRPIVWSQVHQAAEIPFPRFAETDPVPFPGRIPLRRGVVHVRIEENGVEVDVLTAHFKSNLPKLQKRADGTDAPDVTLAAAGESAVRSLVLRAAEALWVRGLVDDIFARSPDHAICVMGDLNDTLESMPVRLVRGIDTTSAHYLRAAEETVAHEQRYSCFHGNARTLIDHLLLSETLHRGLQSTSIQNEELRYHGPHTGEVPMTHDSDHALIVAAIELA